MTRRPLPTQVWQSFLNENLIALSLISHPAISEKNDPWSVAPIAHQPTLLSVAMSMYKVKLHFPGATYKNKKVTVSANSATDAAETAEMMYGGEVLSQPKKC